MAFWDAKIVCEQCNKKAKEKTSLYRRGSRFCSQTCIETWELANPPPVARGEHASLREELAMVLDEAFAEAHRRFGPGINVPLGNNSTLRVDVSFTAMGEAHRIEAMNTAYALFQSHTLRAAPILRALGNVHEATMIDSHDFLQGHSQALIDALVSVRKQL
jgi:hypothetical protein